MQLNDDQKRYFFSQLAGLGRAGKITLSRSTGQMLDSCAYKTQMIFLSCLPEDVMNRHYADTMQNLFFVAGLYCRTTGETTADSVQSQTEGGRTRIEKEIASILMGSTYASETAERKMQDVLGARTGPHGTIYRILGTLLSKSDTKIDCRRLIDDLENWNLPSRDVQKIWALAYIAAKNHTSEKEEIERKTDD